MPKRSPTGYPEAGKGHPRVLTTRRNQCGGCGEYFNSDSPFDRHRIGDFGSETNPRRCMTVEEMKEAGMTINDAGFWVGSAYVDWRS